MRRIATLAVLTLAAACGRDREAAPVVQLAAIERRDIQIDVEATGVVEPINVVEVKSKASGQITRMPVETGSLVSPGDLLVQLDTRDVRNQYNQTLADVRAAEASVAVASAQKKRSDDLFAQRIVTAQEHEQASLQHANAQAQLVRARTNLDLAQQRLEDATVRAPVAGTVIEKSVSLGQVITSATGAFGGGTTLLKMADLGQVRVRALVNETDIGNVAPGQTARVVVDAYPDRPFIGSVEKIEPQAVVQQSVTMFPVLVTIANREGLLKPGMNGEVSILVERRDDVVAVPNEAVRSPREAAPAATALGLDPEVVAEQLRAQFSSLDGGVSGGRVGGRAGSSEAGAVLVSRRGEGADGEQASRALRAQREPAAAADGADCASVMAAFEKQPGLRAQLDSIREGMRAGTIDRDLAREQMQRLLQPLGVSPRAALGCLRGSGEPAAEGATRLESAERATGGRAPGRMGLVFLPDSTSTTYVPRLVRLGVSNYDYSEVLGGLVPGDSVALLGAATLQMQRQERNERVRGMTGGGVPGMSRQAPAGGAGGGARRGGRAP